MKDVIVDIIKYLLTSELFVYKLLGVGIILVIVGLFVLLAFFIFNKKNSENKISDEIDKDDTV